MRRQRVVETEETGEGGNSCDACVSDHRPESGDICVAGVVEGLAGRGRALRGSGGDHGLEGGGVQVDGRGGQHEGVVEDAIVLSREGVSEQGVNVPRGRVNVALGEYEVSPESAGSGAVAREGRDGDGEGDATCGVAEVGHIPQEKVG